MAQDEQGRYWYRWVEEVSSFGIETGNIYGYWVGAQPGEPGAYIGSPPHEGSLDEFIEAAIPAAIGIAGTALISAAVPFASGIAGSTSKAMAAESAANIPVEVEPMWEEESVWGGNGNGEYFPDFPTEGDEPGTSIFNDLGSVISAGLPVLASMGGLGGVVSRAAGGGVIGSMAAGAATLGGRLAAMFGRGAGTFMINGVKGSMSTLWPLVRKYGPTAVATALGISIGALGELLMRAPTTGRKRRRGISASNISTAKRVIRFNRNLSRSLGTNRGRGRSAYRDHGHSVRSYR